MLGNEQRLMVSRRAASNALYRTLLGILVMAFVISLALFYAYFAGWNRNCATASAPKRLRWKVVRRRVN